MPLSRLENFLKNVQGNVIYVNPEELDATDDVSNTGNSRTRPFKTIQRALIESARFSYQLGKDNDKFDKTSASTNTSGSKTAAPDAPKSTSKKKATTAAAATAAPSATSIDLEGLQSLATRFNLEKTWDISDPAEASTLLQRFVDAEQEQVKKEIASLPALVEWENLVDNNFAKVDQAMNALTAACEDDHL